MSMMNEVYEDSWALSQENVPAIWNDEDVPVNWDDDVPVNWDDDIESERRCDDCTGVCTCESDNENDENEYVCENEDVCEIEETPDQNGYLMTQGKRERCQKTKDEISVVDGNRENYGSRTEGHENSFSSNEFEDETETEDEYFKRIKRIQRRRNRNRADVPPPVSMTVSISTVPVKMNPWQKMTPPKIYKIGEKEEEPVIIRSKPLNETKKPLIDQDGFCSVVKKEKKEKAPTATKPCKFGARCRYTDCGFAHNASELVKCKYDDKCKREHCNFFHTRETFEAFKARLG